MARNVSFLDLMFAEALASGLAREAMRAEREKPPPDNFFLLPPDVAAWRKIQDASKKENMVICIEFTDDDCKGVQKMFMDLARQFDSIPFLRAVIELGQTFDIMRSDLGGVRFTPTILVVFYGDNGISRAKYEGRAEVQNVGRIKTVIVELIERRVKLKIAERAAESLAQHVKEHISDKEKKLREEYENKLERQMAEKEEEYKKKDEEKKKKENQEEEEKEKKRRLAKEKLQQERPKHLEELRKMDLDKVSYKELKTMMTKMDISYVGCIDRKDLKEKLLENVPELRLQQLPENRSIDPLGGMSASTEVETLKKELARANDKLQNMTAKATKAEGALRPLESQVASLQNQVFSLKAENNRLQLRSNTNPAAHGAAPGNESVKVRRLEEKLLETRMLYTTSLGDFEIIKVIADSDKDNESLVLRAKCIRPGIPNPNRTYAMKLLSDYLHGKTQTQVRMLFKNEYEVLCQLPPHENIIHMWAFFFDRPGPDIIKHFKKLDGNQRSIGLFILMDEHPMSMAEHLATLTDNRGPLGSKVIEWLKGVFHGLVFLEKHCVVHRDLKLSNLLLTAEGRVVICDFGKAILTDSSFKIPFTYGGADKGGNQAHLAPEILNCRSGPRAYLNYSKQPVWAAGVLAYELAGHRSPFEAGTIDQQGYAVGQLPALRTTYCNTPSHCQKLPGELTKLVETMLQPEPGDRPSLQHCLDVVNNL